MYLMITRVKLMTQKLRVSVVFLKITTFNQRLSKNDCTNVCVSLDRLLPQLNIIKYIIKAHGTTCSSLVNAFGGQGKNYYFIKIHDHTHGPPNMSHKNPHHQLDPLHHLTHRQLSESHHPINPSTVYRKPLWHHTHLICHTTASDIITSHGCHIGDL